MLRASGSPVAVLDCDATGGRALAEDIGVLFYATDVADAAAVDEALASAAKRHGPARIVVNAAAIAPTERVVQRSRDDGPLVRHDISVFRRAIDVNLVGAFVVMATTASAMARLDPIDDDGVRGVIVNVASIAATDGQSGQVAYAASKAALVGMALPAARDLGRYGIRVVSVTPGAFLTPGLAGLPEAVVEGLRSSTPFPQRLGRPGEFADAVRTVIDSKMLNGTSIRLDGALRM